MSSEANTCDLYEKSTEVQGSLTGWTIVRRMLNCCRQIYSNNPFLEDLRTYSRLYHSPKRSSLNTSCGHKRLLSMHILFLASFSWGLSLYHLKRWRFHGRLGRFLFHAIRSSQILPWSNGFMVSLVSILIIRRISLFCRRRKFQCSFERRLMGEFIQQSSWYRGIESGYHSEKSMGSHVSLIFRD